MEANFNPDKQHTVGAEISISGTGLHTGVKVDMTFRPAAPGFGIQFQRIDLPGQPIIKADCDLVTDTSRGTTIEDNGAKEGDTKLNADLLASQPEAPTKKQDNWNLAFQMGGGSGSMREGLSNSYAPRYEAMAGNALLGPSVAAPLDPRRSSARLVRGPAVRARRSFAAHAAPSAMSIVRTVDASAGYHKRSSPFAGTICPRDGSTSSRCG